MKTAHFVGWLAVIALAGAATIAATPAGQFLNPVPAVAAETQATPFVALVSGSGTGSGVHIGHGYILTAGHVANMGGELSAKDSMGRMHKLTVLWVNTRKDLALLKLNDDAPLNAAPLSCDAPVIGQHIRAYGNPLGVESVYSEGKIVGAPISEGPWESVEMLDATIVPGMSGGALVNDAGQVVGINVGVMVYGALTGFGYSVPATSVCELLGRA
jgi:S1-C subfamily serine protease